MSYLSVYIHFVWSTKDRVPFLATRAIRQQVWAHIRENGEKKGIFIDFINGYSEHCHCLVSLGLDQKIKTVVHLMKGESSHWINQQGLLSTLPQAKRNGVTPRFEWQSEYFAASVSQSQVERVRNYLRTQEAHHAKKTFSQECDDLAAVYGGGRFED